MVKPQDVPTQRGSMFSERQRLHKTGETPAQPDGVSEQDLYEA